VERASRVDAANRDAVPLEESTCLADSSGLELRSAQEIDVAAERAQFDTVIAERGCCFSDLLDSPLWAPEHREGELQWTELDRDELTRYQRSEKRLASRDRTSEW
jgi:hypothetical protein